jgi:hypothetical protein
MELPIEQVFHNKFFYFSAGNRLNTANKLMITSFATLSKTAICNHIWALRAENGYTGKSKDIKSLKDAELEDFYNKAPLLETPSTVSTTTVEETTNIIPRVTSKGEPYFTIGLELVETNGLSFRFKYNDKIVTVSSDVDLYKVHKETPIAIGTIMHFNYEGTETFKELTKDILVANNNVENRYRGTLSKSCNEIFAIRLIQKEEKRMQKTIAVMETADELGVSTRQVRKVMSNNLNTDIAERMKAKLG